ncbi:HD domain-containing protein [Mucilaginibacter robiniae]|uniref:HD domain-containing protein n=1 Tax=Mucilaginibacter robiniae TaxID=2728022 RepID=A0A7L5E7I4_9SPHI|nr:HD domain-containing protein [Mucilaginibacter robiniae]QJD96823.1 HD domain-containing protein [Mucilaginibacter robiniae]
MQFEQAGNFIMNKLRQELPNHLYYHSIEHVQDVYEAAEMLAKQEGLSAYETQLLLTAARYHDAGFLKGSQDHEEESCRIAQENLPTYGYNEEEISRICGIIMATRLPQTPKNHLEEILADADLDYLGRDDFFAVGYKLFQELLSFGVLSTEEEWNKLQVRFLESHHYFTSTAIQLRQEKKQVHLALIKEKLKL